MNFWEIAISIYLLFGCAFTYCYFLILPSKHKNDKLVMFILGIILIILWPLIITYFMIYSVVFSKTSSMEVVSHSQPMSISQRMYEMNKQNAQNSPQIQWIDYDEFIKNDNV